jgi:c-di-GMP phosphodiesterase
LDTTHDIPRPGTLHRADIGEDSPSQQMTQHAPPPEVLLARQPILNGNLTAVGYELLYRERASEHANVHDDELATARVSLNAMTEMDLERLVDQRRAWINVTREFVLGGLAETIPPDRVVLELLEDQFVDEALIAALDKLRSAGYLVALDDFTLTPNIEPLLSRVDIVKLDLRALGAEGLTALARDLAPHRLTLVAEKLEDHADFEVALAAGCHLFQGYFFCRPEPIEGTSVAPSQLALLKLAAEVQDPAVDLAALDRVISTDVALSYRLLRYINSAYFSVRQPVSTVMQAVTLLGIDNVRSWTTMMILAQIGGKPRELFVTALVRARFCQLAGENEEGPSSEMFALGLFSVIDALTDRPMASVVQLLPFPTAMREALVDRSGPGRLLDSVEAMEAGAFRRARDLVPNAPEHYLEAVAWSNETARHLVDGAAPAAA